MRQRLKELRAEHLIDERWVCPVALQGDRAGLKGHGRLPWEGFAPGSERGETRAKEEIWLDEDRFKAMATKLQAKTTELSRAAAAGSLPVLMVAFEQTRDACDACHKEFRKK